MKRKEFLKMMAAGMAAPLAGCYTAGRGMPKARNAHLNLEKVFGPTGPRGEYHAFSKMFQFLDYDRCAETLAKAGATGIEWTVRKGGHVEPARVKDDLPKAVAAAHKQGLKSEMMVVSYTRADEPGADEVFKVAADCGIRQFRPGYFAYAKGETAAQIADRVKAAFASYVRLGEKTGLRSVHHNHNTVDGVGFACGLERVMLAGGGNVINAGETEIMVIGTGKEANGMALKVAHLLRNTSLNWDSFRTNEIRVAVDCSDKSLKSKMRRANKMGAKLVVIFDEQEAMKKTDKIYVRDMIHSKQVSLSELTELVGHVVDWFHEEYPCGYPYGY